MSVSITFQKDLFGKEELSIVYGVFHMGIGLGALIVPFITGQLESMLKRRSQGKEKYAKEWPDQNVNYFSKPLVLFFFLRRYLGNLRRQFRF